MITADVRDWLKDQFQDVVMYLGRFDDTKREKLMRITRGTTVSQQRPIGGIVNASYSRLACNCILHWNKNAKETEIKANQILDFILGSDHPNIGGYQVVMIIVRNFVPLDFDENDIYEYALDFEIIYMRNKEALESEI